MAYTVVTDGLAVTTGPLAVFKVALGVHVYVCAPAAVKFTLVPAHMLPDVVEITGFGITLTLKVVELVQVPLDPTIVPEIIEEKPSDVATMDEPAGKGTGPISQCHVGGLVRDGNPRLLRRGGPGCRISR